MRVSKSRLVIIQFKCVLSVRENRPTPVHMNMEFTETACTLVNQGWLYQCIER